MKKIVFIAVAFSIMLLTTMTLYSQRDPKPQSNFVHTDYSAGKVAYNDSTYIDSTRYPQITNVFDASLITGEVDSLYSLPTTNGQKADKSGILFRASLIVKGPTGIPVTTRSDTVWVIIQTRDEGGYRWRNDDTITIVGADSITTGTCTFSDYPRSNWRLRIEEKKTLDHVNYTNRNGDYLLISFTAKNMDFIPPKINPGNGGGGSSNFRSYQDLKN